MLPVLVAVGVIAPSAHAAETVVSIGGDPEKVTTFSAAAPATALSGPAPITGVVGLEVPAAIDVRPSTGELYMLAVNTADSGLNPDSGHLYKLNPVTGAATIFGPQQNGLITDAYDIDFDPVNDQIRVLGGYQSPDHVHRLLNPDTGLSLGDHPALHFEPPGATNFAGAAYTNNFPGAVATTYFVVGTSQLARMGSVNGTPISPNTGRLFLIGDFVDGSESFTPEGLDISGGTGLAYAQLLEEDPGSGAFDIVTLMNLANGSFTKIGVTPFGKASTDIAVGSPIVTLGPPTTSVTEGGRAAFTVTRRGIHTGPVVVGYQAVAGSAAAADFTTVTGTLSFGSGENSKRIEVPTAKDSVDEKPETLSLRLGAVPGNANSVAVFGNPRQATVTIADALASASRLSMTNRVFAPTRARASGRKKPRVKRGTAFRYRLSENARVTIRVDRRLRGRRVKRGGRIRCVKPTRQNRRRRRCVRFKRTGALVVPSAKAGANRTRFSGRFKRRALRPGRYRATLVATDGGGGRSKPVRITFRVVRG